MGLVTATYLCLCINGSIGFQFAKDGTLLSLWVWLLSFISMTRQHAKASLGCSFYDSVALLSLESCFLSPLQCLRAPLLYPVPILIPL